MPLVPPHVIVGGAGPGGIAAARKLLAAGARVTILEREAATTASELARSARRSSVTVGPDAWPTLRRLGAGHLLDDPRAYSGPRTRLVSLSGLDEALRTALEGERLVPRYATSIRRVETTPAGDGVNVAVRDARAGTDEILHADWYIDATGSTARIDDQPALARQLVPGRRVDPERAFITVQTKAQPHVGAARRDPASDVFMLNNKREGINTIYRPVDPAVAPSPAQREQLAAETLATLRIPRRDVVTPARFIRAKQTLAGQAAAGRILLVGDSVATHLPVRQAGVTLALQDGERAAETITDAWRRGIPAEHAATRYSDTTIAVHRMFMM